MKSIIKLLISIGFIVMLVIIGIKVNAQSIKINVDNYMKQQYSEILDSLSYKPNYKYNSSNNKQPVVNDWSNEAVNTSNKLSNSNIEFNNTVKNSIIGNKTTIDVYNNNTGNTKRYNVTTYQRNSIIW